MWRTRRFPTGDSVTVPTWCALVIALVGCGPNATAIAPSAPATSASATPPTGPSTAIATATATAAAASASPVTTDVRELAAVPAPLPAGTYTASAFRPAVTLELDGSWTSVNRFDDFFDVEQDVGSPDVIAVQLARPKALIGLDGAPIEVGLPREAQQVLSDNPGLEIVARSESRIGGLEGRVVEIENRSGAHVGVLTLGPGTLGIDSGRRLWIAFFGTPDGLVAVMVGGSVARWQAALDTAEPVLESIRFPGLG